MSDLRVQLTNDFRSQERFAAGYSPLYALLFGIVAGWLAAERPDPVVDWLLAAAAERRPFDVTLLLPAALHRDVLAGVPAAAPLAPVYPSVGGTVPGAPAADLAAALRQVVLARGDALAAGGQTDISANMLYDLMVGRQTEIEAIAGDLVRLASDAGISVPGINFVYRAIRGIDHWARS